MKRLFLIILSESMKNQDLRPKTRGHYHKKKKKDNDNDDDDIMISQKLIKWVKQRQRSSTKTLYQEKFIQAKL
jgi:hypothetical protein